jgi:hypothetical protein
MLISKCFNHYQKFMVIFYIFYGILMFCVEEWVFEEWKDAKSIHHNVEITFTALFLIEVLVHTTSFGGLFIKDPYSIADTIVISGNLIFLVLHEALTPGESEEVLHPMAKFYGILRILHACLIFRKMDEVIKNYKAINRVSKRMQH